MLTSGGTELGQVDIRRGMFQGDSLSPLLLIVVILPLILELRKINLDTAGLSLIFRAPVAKKVHSYSSYSGGGVHGHAHARRDSFQNHTGQH